MRKVTILIEQGRIEDQKVGMYEATPSAWFPTRNINRSAHEQIFDLPQLDRDYYMRTINDILQGLTNKAGTSKAECGLQFDTKLEYIITLTNGVLRSHLGFIRAKQGEEIKLTYMFSATRLGDANWSILVPYMIIPFNMHLPRFSSTSARYEDVFSSITTVESNTDLASKEADPNKLYITVFIPNKLLEKDEDWTNLILKPQLRAIYEHSKKQSSIVEVEIVLYYGQDTTQITEKDIKNSLEKISGVLEEICEGDERNNIPINYIDGPNLVSIRKRTDRMEEDNLTISIPIRVCHVIGSHENIDSINDEILSAIRNLTGLSAKFLFTAFGANVISYRNDIASSIFDYLHRELRAHTSSIGALAFWWPTPSFWLEKLSEFFYQELITQVRYEERVCFTAALRFARQKLIQVNGEGANTSGDILDSYIFATKAHLEAYSYANPLLINNYCLRMNCLCCEGIEPERVIKIKLEPQEQLIFSQLNQIPGIENPYRRRTLVKILGIMLPDTWEDTQSDLEYMAQEINSMRKAQVQTLPLMDLLERCKTR